MDIKTVLIRLVLATLLGGVIGMERERKSRPAGFRTHILVCLGSTLVMMISEMLFLQYEGRATVDPTRLGAQVISGIGFLGAGTIIRQGASVKGLTTAATLWATSCIGLSIGAGFYSGAVIGGVIIFVVLFVLGYIEKTFGNKSTTATITISEDDYFITLENITKKLENNDVTVKSIEFLNDHENDEGNICTRYYLKMPRILKLKEVMLPIKKLDGVMEVDF